MVAMARKVATEEEYAKEGERLVIIAGIPFGRQGSTNNLRVLRL